MPSEMNGSTSEINLTQAIADLPTRVRSTLTEPYLLLFCGVLCLAIFLFDVSTKIGFIVSILYVVPIVISSWSPRRRTIFLLAIVTSILTVIAVPLKPPGDFEFAIFNRPVTLSVIWLVTILEDQNVSRQKKANEELKISEEKASALIKLAPVGIYELDYRIPKFIKVNDAMSHILGYNEQELLSLNPSDIMDEGSKKLFAERIRKILSGEKVDESASFTVIAKDGRKVFANLNVKMIYEKGKPSKAFVIAYDNTERRKIELLSEGLNQINALINSTLDSNEIMRRVLIEGVKTLEAESSIVNMREGDYWVARFAYNFPPGIMNVPKTNEESPTSMLVVEEKKAIAIDDAQQDPRVDRKAMKAFNVQSVLVAPIVSRGRILGIIAFYYHSKQIKFSSAQIDFVNKLATALSMALENAHLFESVTESEAQLHTALESMMDAVFISDKDGNFINFNEAFVKYHRFHSREEASKNITECPNYIEAHFADGTLAPPRMWAVPRALRGETVRNTEYFLRRKDTGEEWWGSYSFGPIRDKDDHIIGSVVVTRDITESKKMEMALKKSENGLVNAQRIAHLGSWEWDIQTGKVTWSPELYNIYGLDPNTFVPTIASFADYIHPDDRELVNREIEKIVSKGESVSFDFRIISADGSIHFLNTKGEISVFDENGSPRLMAGTNQDITERKKIEEELQATLERFYQILSGMSYAILLVTAQDRVEFANQAFCDIFNLKESPSDLTNLSANEMIERIRLSYLNPEMAVDHIKEIVKSGQPVTGEEISMSQDRTYLRDFIPIQLGGILYGRLWVHRDITLRKKAEHEVIERTKELTRSNAELQQFAYVASHDLQEPLRMVVNYVSLLERRNKDKLDPISEEYIGYAVEGGKRMRELIDNLLEYTRIETRGKELAPVDMQEVVNKTISILKVPIEDNNAEIIIGTLPTIMADESQMIQVMQNLIGNALKFHGPDQPRIHISAIKGHKEWTFAVEDNGIGLNMEYADRIFQMFQRLHNRTEYPGTGVGLAITKRIIEHHHGRIWVESKEGKGATFFFTIPIPLIYQQGNLDNLIL